MESGYLFQICTFLKGAKLEWMEDQKVPYAHKNNEWVGFDTRESYETKVGMGEALHNVERDHIGVLNIKYKTFYHTIKINQNSQVSIKSVIIFTNPQVRYMQEQKFGGAFVWALDLDDFKGHFCGEGIHPLLSHLRTLLDIGISHDFF